MAIQINNLNNETKPSIVKSKIVICPKCKENSRIQMNNFRINIYGCKNNHNASNILIEEYSNFQNIDESKIVCDKCGNKKSDSYNKIFYRCNTCKINLCITCKERHDNNHNIVEYDKKYFVCEEHNDIFISYCKTCCKNICILCEEQHNNHEIITFGKILCKKEDVLNSMKELKN